MSTTITKPTTRPEELDRQRQQRDHGFPGAEPALRVVPPGSQEAFRPGVAIGDHILDLAALAAKTLRGQGRRSAGRLHGRQPERADGAGPAALERAAPGAVARPARSAALRATIEPLLVAQADAEYATPARIGDYTDFYISLHHATAVGKQFRPDNPAAELQVGAHRLSRARLQHRRGPEVRAPGRPDPPAERRRGAAIRPARAWTMNWNWASSSAPATPRATVSRWPTPNRMCSACAS